MEEDIKIIKETIYNEDGKHQEYIDIDNTIYNECEEFIKAIENILLEREKDKKRIEELEDQKNELMNEYHKRVQERINLEQDLKILQDDLEDKRIVYIDTPEFKDSYIAKGKVKDKIEEIEYYFDRLNVPDEDIEFIREVKKELLEEEN